MQAVEVKAMAQNAVVYMRSVRSRHLRLALKRGSQPEGPFMPLSEELLTNLSDF